MSTSANPVISDAPCVLFAYHDVGYACLDALLQLGAPISALFTHHDDPGEEIWWRSCTDLADCNSIPVHFIDKPDPALPSIVQRFNPAIIYSFFYRHLLPDSVLSIPRLGAYNLHGSLLPKYRGRAPVNWVLVNGEHETGMTLHHMVARADAGDIVAQRAVVIADSDDALTLYRRLVPLGAALIAEFHPLIVSGRAPRRSQDLSRSSYFGRRRPEDGKIDWSWPARRICNLVRAVAHPYPGAFCNFRGRKLFVWKARIGSESASCGAPGAALTTAADGVEVAAGEGTVVIVRVQFEGGIESAAGEILEGAIDDKLT